MPTFNIELNGREDIEVDEFLEKCSSQEITEVINFLIEEEYIRDTDIIVNEFSNYNDEEWYLVLNKLSGNARLSLTNEEEDIIKKIASRF